MASFGDSGSTLSQRNVKKIQKGHEQTLALDRFSILKPGVAMIAFRCCVQLCCFASNQSGVLETWRPPG